MQEDDEQDHLRSLNSSMGSSNENYLEGSDDKELKANKNSFK